MKRRTNRLPSGKIEIIDNHGALCCGGHINDLSISLEKFASYEDTNLTPEEINKMKVDFSELKNRMSWIDYPERMGR